MKKNTKRKSTRVMKSITRKMTNIKKMINTRVMIIAVMDHTKRRRMTNTAAAVDLIRKRSMIDLQTFQKCLREKKLSLPLLDCVRERNQFYISSF